MAQARAVLGKVMPGTRVGPRAISVQHFDARGDQVTINRSANRRWRVGRGDRPAFIINFALCAEAFAVTVEALILAVVGRWREWPRREWLWCFGLSFVASAASATTGELLYFALDKPGVSLI